MNFQIRSLILLLLGLFAISLYGLKDFKTRYSTDQFYPEGHELLKNKQEIERVFRLSESSPYLFVISQEMSWLNSMGLRSLKNLEEVLQEQDEVQKIITLTNVEGASSIQDELIIGNIFARTPASSWEERVLNNPLLYPLLITRDLKTTLIVIEGNEKIKDPEIFQKKIMALMKKNLPGILVQGAGVPLLQARLSQKIQEELMFFLVCTSAIFCFIFYLLFSHWSAIACTFITLAFTNIFGLSLMTIMGVSMNVILVTLPVIISVSVMSLLIHSLHLWGTSDHSMLSLNERYQMALKTLKEIFLPNILGILTTAFGFLALFPSEIPIISEYGLTVSIILLSVALLSQATLLVLLPFVKPQMRSWFKAQAFWSLKSLKYSRVIIVLMITTSLGGLYFLQDLNFSFRLFDDLPRNEQVKQTTDQVDEHFGGIVSYDLKLDATGNGFWKELSQMQDLHRLLKALRKNPQIQTVLSVPDFFQGPVPDKQEALSETLFMFSMASANPLNSYMTEDGKTLRIAFRFRDLPSHEIDEVRDFIRTQVRETFPTIQLKEGGLGSYAHVINQNVAKKLIFEFWHPLLFIGIFLILIFRSLKWAIISCLPNLVPPAILIGTLGVMEVPVKPATALIFSIALGFAFNNTLYLLTRLKRLIKTNPHRALEKTLLLEATPCLFESFIMFVGFSIFLVSDFHMNQIFGGFMLLSILAGLAADLTFLPAILKSFPQIYLEKTTSLVRPRLASMLFVIGATLSFPSLTLALPDAKDILQKSQKLLDAKDDKASVEMKIIEQNGEIKSRVLKLQTLRQDGFSVLARIESPSDIKDMAFLGNVDEEGNEKQWIFLPSSGKVRRLVTGKSKAGLLGSEISPEDLNSEAVKSSSVKMVKVDKDYFWIEMIPSSGTSEYSKVVTKISKDDLLPKFTAYYLKDKLKKTVSFKDYKKFGNVYRAQVFNVQNHLNGRGTVVRLSSIRVNTGLSKNDFSQSSLKD